MNATGPRLDRDVLAQMGRDVYARIVRPKLRPEDHGKFVVIDVESGAFEVDASPLAASTRLHAGDAGVGRTGRLSFRLDVAKPEDRVSQNDWFTRGRVRCLLARRASEGPAADAEDQEATGTDDRTVCRTGGWPLARASG
jgi:hypothetical protein